MYSHVLVCRTLEAPLIRGVGATESRSD